MITTYITSDDDVTVSSPVYDCSRKHTHITPTSHQSSHSYHLTIIINTTVTITFHVTDTITITITIVHGIPACMYNHWQEHYQFLIFIALSEIPKQFSKATIRTLLIFVFFIFTTFSLNHPKQDTILILVVDGSNLSSLQPSRWILVICLLFSIHTQSLLFIFIFNPNIMSSLQER